jgi:outer membrane immunogenic protein
MNALNRRRFTYRRLTFAAALAAMTAAFTPPVVAADLPVKAPPGPAVAPSWTGYYFGVHGGWAWATTDIKDPQQNPIFDPLRVKLNGPLAGGALGANWQYGNVVYGVELDGSWAFLRGPVTREESVVASSTARQRIDFRALATGTGRISHAWPIGRIETMV